MEFFTTVIQWLTGHVPEVLQIIGGFAVIAMFTPNKADDKIVKMLLDAVNFLGGNMRNAKNSDD